MFLVTQSFVERGQFDINVKNLGTQGVDGNYYAPYGITPSLMAVPFYYAGRTASTIFPWWYKDFITRLFVSLLDPFLVASTCVLFFYVCQLVNYDRLTSVALTLGYGVTTFVWPYSKYAWSEPKTGFWLLLSFLLVLLSVKRSSSLLSFTGGLALGLACSSKISTLVVAPCFVTYLLIARAPSFQLSKISLSRRYALRIVSFILGLLIILSGVAIYNLARFGDVTKTGYYANLYFDFSRSDGILGLLFSPGKSIFLYAPIALMGVFGLATFARTRPAEALLGTLVVATHVVTYGLLTFWAGDAAWGPRYLVPVTAFLVLPAGALLSRAGQRRRTLVWLTFSSLGLAGVVINLGGVLVDQRIYYIITAHQVHDDEALSRLRYWTPSASPAVAAWMLAGDRLPLFSAALHTRVWLQDGFWSAEGQPEQLFPRWTTGTGRIQISEPGPVVVQIVYADLGPKPLPQGLPAFSVGGVPLLESSIDRAEVGRRVWSVRLNIDAVDPPASGHMLEISTPTFNPARDFPPSSDSRELGVRMLDLKVESRGLELPVGDQPLTPMPISPEQPWSSDVAVWYYTSKNAVDDWAWYWYVSGLPKWPIGMSIVFAIGVFVSGAFVARSIRSAMRASVASSR